jgi:hypothetical protein
MLACRVCTSELARLQLALWVTGWRNIFGCNEWYWYDQFLQFIVVDIKEWHTYIYTHLLLPVGQQPLQRILHVHQ